MKLYICHLKLFSYVWFAIKMYQNFHLHDTRLYIISSKLSSHSIACLPLCFLDAAVFPTEI